MKDFKAIFIFFLILCFSCNSYAQLEDANSIDNNSDLSHLNLEQSLSSSQDTLTLKSELNILRITFLSHETRGAIIVDINSPMVKIPLQYFKKGKYTLAVYRKDKIIPLRFNQLIEFPKPENENFNLEESIIKSSISTEERLARNRALLTRYSQSAIVDTLIVGEKPMLKRKQRKDNTVLYIKRKSPFDVVVDTEKVSVANILNRKHSNER